MKILFISFFFPPYNSIGSIRTGKTAKILRELGHDVYVIAGKENSLNTDLPLEISKDMVFYIEHIDFESKILNILGKNKNEIKNSISTNKSNLNLLISLYKYIFYTPDKYVSWFFPALNNAKKVINEWRPDLIYASAMPYTSLMVAAYLSKKFGIPYVAELRDLWIDNHYIRHNFLSKILEKKTLNIASAIVTVSEPLADKLKKRYKKPVVVIYNAYDEEDFENIEENNRDNEYKIEITYTGSIYYGKRDPSLLFEAIKNSKELRDRVKCRFYGDSLNFIKELARKYEIEDNIEVFPPVSRNESLKIQKNSDILLLLTWNDPKEQGIYTGKLFEYIGNKKPILAIGNINDVAAKLINNYGFGLATNDINKITEFIINSKNPVFLNKIKSNYKEYRHFFERRMQVEKLSEIFRNIVYEKL